MTTASSPVYAVTRLKAAAKLPHVTAALADLRGITLSYVAGKHDPASSGVNQDVVALAQRFAQLVSEYNPAIGDSKITRNEAKRMLRGTIAIQQVFLDMKLNLEDEVSQIGSPPLWGRAGLTPPLVRSVGARPGS